MHIACVCFDLILYIPANNFSVRSGLAQYLVGDKVSCSRPQHSDSDAVSLKHKKFGFLCLFIILQFEWKVLLKKLSLCLLASSAETQQTVWTKIKP